MKPPSLKAIMVGLIPFAGMCFSVPLWDQVDPTILGVPFNLAWLICWIVLTSACLGIASKIEQSGGHALRESARDPTAPNPEDREE